MTLPRLCTVAELEASCAALTGCGFDAQLWSGPASLRPSHPQLATLVPTGSTCDASLVVINFFCAHDEPRTRRGARILHVPLERGVPGAATPTSLDQADVGKRSGGGGAGVFATASGADQVTNQPVRDRRGEKPHSVEFIICFFCLKPRSGG